MDFGLAARRTGRRDRLTGGLVATGPIWSSPRQAPIELDSADLSVSSGATAAENGDWTVPESVSTDCTQTELLRLSVFIVNELAYCGYCHQTTLQRTRGLLSMICDLAVIVSDRMIRMVSTLCTEYALIFHQLRKVLVLLAVHSFSSSMSH